MTSYIQNKMASTIANLTRIAKDKTTLIAAIQRIANAKSNYYQTVEDHQKEKEGKATRDKIAFAKYRKIAQVIANQKGVVAGHEMVALIIN